MINTPQNGDMAATRAAKIADKITLVFVCIWYQSHLTSFFYLFGKTALMFGTSAGKAARRYLATLRDISPHQISVFIIDLCILVFTKETDLFLKNEPSTFIIPIE